MAKLASTRVYGSLVVDNTLSVGAISTSGQLSSTLANGTAPFSIASTTLVTNLNADRVDGYHASELWRSDGGTWNPGADIKLNQTANGQEWSFDITRNGYTGGRWHVYDSVNSTMLQVDAVTGKVSAPYNFVGNLEGIANSAINADKLDEQHGSYYDHRAYTDANNYLGGHYTSGGDEKPNSAAFGAGKLKLAMLGGSNLGVGGSYSDVLWLSGYSGGDVKGSHALIFDKYSTDIFVADVNWDATSWGTPVKLWHTGNDGSGSGLDADLLDGLHASSFVRSDTGDAVAGNHEFYAIDTSGAYSEAAIELREANLVFNTQSADSYAPSISWHWGGVAQNKIFLSADGQMYLDGSAGTKGKLWHSNNDGSGSGLDADLLDGLQLNSTVTNNEVNKVVRTDDNGYTNFGWINTISGNTESAVTDVYVNTNDGYIRKKTLALFKAELGTMPVSVSSTSSKNYLLGTSLGTGSNSTIYRTSYVYMDGTIMKFEPTGTISFLSDGRLKNIKGKIDKNNILDRFSETPIYKYTYKGHDDSPQVGIIAQDLEKNFPDLKEELINVNSVDGDVEDQLSINETKLVYLLWEALQEEIKERKALESYIKYKFNE